ncbi:hypothetical protein CHS0354_000984 [Potamilus streckersoni]|uniref:Sushi domain-containing protein n=1 Tax=Potamilus streckersoni TaxID=2493646 RepID=A0AAE0VX60_9BIVA|nr:hypothetical protein CHS0354_000984 [Potamilus streckersoni]
MNCPHIAEPQEIITSDNLEDLAVDNKNVTPGTTVNVRCLSSESHTLTGEKSLTCLDSGQWNHPIPKCVPNSWNENIQFLNPMINGTMSKQELHFGKFPLIVLLCLLCFSCISIVIFLAHLIYARRKRAAKRMKKRNRSQSIRYNRKTASMAKELTTNIDQSNLFRAIDTEESYHVPSISFHVPSMPYHVPFYSGRMTGSL